MGAACTKLKDILGARWTTFFGSFGRRGFQARDGVGHLEADWEGDFLEGDFLEGDFLEGDLGGVGADSVGVGSDLIGAGAGLVGGGADSVGVGADLIGVGAGLMGVGADLVGVGADMVGIGADLVLGADLGLDFFENCFQALDASTGSRPGTCRRPPSPV